MNRQKWIALALCACMLFTVALAEDAPAPEVTQAVATTLHEMQDADVIASVNGEPLTWADAKAYYDSLANQYGSYYDMTLSENVQMFRAAAMANAVTYRVLMNKAKEQGFDQLTDEEKTAADTSAQSDWDSAIESYIANYHSDLTDESTAEEKAAANDEAVKYFNDLGYSPEKLMADYEAYAAIDKVRAYATQDAVVTDEDVEAAYQALVAADKKLYQNDIDAYIAYNNNVDMYAYYAAMSGSSSDMEYAWYKPAGFRAVKHILLTVDDELMSAYTDLLARYEEQQDAEEAAADATAEPTVEAETEADATDATATPTPEPVTEEQVNAAKAAILESLAEKIDEINQKIADGADFDALIAEYAVGADGTPTDPGMVNEPGKTSGYEVAQGSTSYVPEFVQAAFSVDNVGEVSAPYISSYGVHIVKYVGDVPEGPVVMTDAQRSAKLQSMLSTQQEALYSTALTEWEEASTIEYTGLIPSMAEIMEQEAAAAETEVATEEEAAQQVEEPTPAE